MSALPALVAAVLALARWLLQGSGNIYTRLSDRYYVPNGERWSFVEDGAPWLGLDVVLTLFATAIGIALVTWFAKQKGFHGFARLLWIPALACLSVPIWAFSQGLRPDGARDSAPSVETTGDLAGLEGALEAPAGRYNVTNTGEIVASVKAGGETFDARFAKSLKGHWKGTPENFAEAMTAEFSVAADDVDTGIGLRNKHAREKLLVEDHPRITFTLDRLIASAQLEPDTVEFVGSGTVLLAGSTKTVEVRGTVTRESGPEKASMLSINAKMEYPLSSTPLAEGDTFDEDTMPIRVSVSLQHESNVP